MCEAEVWPFTLGRPAPRSERPRRYGSTAHACVNADILDAVRAVLGDVQTEHALAKRASRTAETVETENPLAGAAPAPRTARPADKQQQQQEEEGRPALMKKAPRRRPPPSPTAADAARRGSR